MNKFPIVLIIVTAVSGFPVNPMISFTPTSFNASSQVLLSTYVDATADLILYVSTLSISGNEIWLSCHNASGSVVT